MEGEPPPEDATLFPATVGERLRAARVALGLDLSEIAANTRIPQRHLETIEKSNYGALPSATYALGFAKAYARTVGVDEVALARDLRVELGSIYERPAPMPAYDLDDANRGAPSGLVWGSVIIAVLVLVGAAIWYGTGLFRGTPPPAETLLVPEPTPSPEAQPTPVGSGHVALIATDTVWLRVSDATGKILFEKEMAPGERYDVPDDADHPRARTARPDRVQVTLNGSIVAPLGAGAQTVDVEVGADALNARGQPTATPAPSRATVPTPTPTPTPTPRAALPALAPAAAAAPADLAPAGDAAANP